MKGKLFLAGLIGAAIGGAVTYICARYYYENKVLEVIPFEPEEATQTEEQILEPVNEEDDISSLSVKQYAQRLQKREEYTDYSAPVKSVEKTETHESVRCIPYAEYYENKDFADVTLYYYEDGVLANEEDEIIDEETAERKLGKNWNDKMELYDDDCDSAYFVNEDFEMYYEILRSAKYYYGDVVPDDDES